MWDIVGEFYRAWKVSPTLEMMSDNVSRILGESYSFWEEEERPSIIRVEEQEWFQAIQNPLCILSDCWKVRATNRDETVDFLTSDLIP